MLFTLASPRFGRAVIPGVNIVAVSGHQLAARGYRDEVSEHFGYAIDKRYLPVVLPFLLRPAKDGVTLTDECTVVATFGLFKIVTPRARRHPRAHQTGGRVLLA